VTSRKLLHQYWFRFDCSGEDSLLRLGAGVTAFSKEDALALLGGELAPRDLPSIAEVSEDIRFDQLDKLHVVPNMHPITERGVWFPMMRAFS
jgi:hypothetical protein